MEQCVTHRNEETRKCSQFEAAIILGYLLIYDVFFRNCSKNIADQDPFKVPIPNNRDRNRDPKKPVFPKRPSLDNAGALLETSNMGKWITANQLLRRWSVAPATIFDAVEKGLPTYREWTQGKPKKVDMRDFVRHFSRMHDHSEAEKWFPVILFNMRDIESFEDEHPEEVGMTAKEHIDYNRLKAERENFTDAISATVKGLIHCQSQQSPAGKTEFKNFIEKAYPGLPDSSIYEIWRAIPSKHKIVGWPRLSEKK